MHPDSSLGILKFTLLSPITELHQVGGPNRIYSNRTTTAAAVIVSNIAPGIERSICNEYHLKLCCLPENVLVKPDLAFRHQTM